MDGQGQVSQSFPAIFEPPLPGFNMHLVVVNLWPISFFKINSNNPPPTHTHTHIPRNSIIKLSEAKRQRENLERRKKCITKKGSPIRLIANFLSETMGARGQIFKVLKEKLTKKIKNQKLSTKNSIFGKNVFKS